jgi:hypothetical protein
MNSPPHQIVRREETRRWALYELRAFYGGPTTVVFGDARGNLFVAQRPPTAAELMLRPPKVVYTVDTAEHPEQFSVNLPSYEDTAFFEAQIALVWQVRDAVAAVASGLSEPQGAYRPQVEEILRGVARMYSIENGAAAERAMNDAFTTPRPAAQGVFVVRCTVQLTRDDRAPQRKQEVETRLLDQRLGFFTDMLANGKDPDIALMALKLAGGNQDVDGVIQLILSRERFDFEGARGALDAMMENGLINRSQLDHILARVNAVMSKHLTSPPFSIANRDEASLPRGDDPLTVDAWATDANVGMPGVSASRRAPEADDEKQPGDDEDEYTDEDEDGPS